MARNAWRPFLWAILLLALAHANSRAEGNPPQQKPLPEEVVFPGGGRELHGFLWKPEGDGPFPAVLWNHGSEKLPGSQPARREQLRKTLPIRRVVVAGDIAALAVHLMTNTAVSGATYDLDGRQQLVEG
jgi:hypothetical protein